jgi:hypothetical protein
MIARREFFISLSIIPALSGCNTPDNAPLVFYQATTLGISASSTGAQATPELSLGYRDTDVAIVPIAAYGKPVRSVLPGGNGQTFQDALSVLGQFQVNTAAGAAPNVGLGKFFATGAAAKRLADGFAHQLSK